MATQKKTNPIKAWFITYPQSKDVSLEQMLDCYIGSWDVVYYNIVKELHEDGNPHLHMGIIYKGKHTMNSLRARAKRFFPNEDKRIDYQTMKSSSREELEQYLGKDPIEKKEWGTFKLREMSEKRKREIEENLRIWETRAKLEQKVEEFPETRVSDKFTARRKSVQEQDSKIKWIKLRHDVWMINEFPNWFGRYKSHLCYLKK